MKECTDCGESKPLDEFQKRATSKDGHAGKCKPCKRTYDNAHYSRSTTRQDSIRVNQKARREANTLWLIDFLSKNPCVDCAEGDIVVLQFDHQCDKKFNVSNMVFSHGLNKLQEEVAKCVIRCANCHTKKTARDFGWTKYLTTSMLP